MTEESLSKNYIISEFLPKFLTNEYKAALKITVITKKPIQPIITALIVSVTAEKSSIPTRYFISASYIIIAVIQAPKLKSGTLKKFFIFLLLNIVIIGIIHGYNQ